MTRPKVYRDLFDNDGAGPKLKEDILPNNAVGSSYLPLAGGTMTGPIKMGESSSWTSNRIILVPAEGQAGAFVQKANDTGHIRLDGGSDYNSGASFVAYGKSSSDNAGCFKAYASNGTNTATLLGTPDGTLTWSGTSFTAPTLQATSDARLKENIEEASADLSSLSPKHYVLKADKKEHVGLIAQDVLKICPEAVSKGEDGYYSLDYNAIVALLVGEVNALKKEIKALKGE